MPLSRRLQLVAPARPDVAQRRHHDVLRQPIRTAAGVDDPQGGQVQIPHGRLHRASYSRSVLILDLDAPVAATPLPEQVQLGASVNAPEEELGVHPVQRPRDGFQREALPRRPELGGGLQLRRRVQRQKGVQQAGVSQVQLGAAHQPLADTGVHGASSRIMNAPSRMSQYFRTVMSDTPNDRPSSE